MMQFRQTARQTARGAKPDLETGRAWYLIKHVSFLRLTYQIRMLAYLAIQARQVLVIRLPKAAKVHPHLAGFVRDARPSVKIERV